MKIQFGKCENEVIKCWSQTVYLEFFLAVKHDFSLFDMQKKSQLSIFRSQHRKFTWQSYRVDCIQTKADSVEACGVLVRCLLFQNKGAAF